MLLLLTPRLAHNEKVKTFSINPASAGRLFTIVMNYLQQCIGYPKNKYARMIDAMIPTRSASSMAPTA